MSFFLDKTEDFQFPLKWLNCRKQLCLAPAFNQQHCLLSRHKQTHTRWYLEPWYQRLRLTVFCTGVFLSTDQSESNSTSTRTPPPLTLQGRLSHAAARLHMPPEGTSKYRPRTQQITTRSSSYLQPTIICVHYPNGGTELAQLLLLQRWSDWNGSALFLPLLPHDPDTLCEYVIVFPLRLQHRGHSRYLSTESSGDVCKADTLQRRAKCIPQQAHKA